MSANEKKGAQAEREFLDMINERATNTRRQAEEMDKTARAMNEARRAKKRRKAFRRFVLRMITCVVLCLLTYAAQVAQLIVGQLAIVVGAGVMVWAALWVGAFWQFMYPGGGLFDAE